MTAALRITGPTAPMLINGPVDTEVFRAYVQHLLLPTLRPGDIVVLDKLASLRAPDLRQRIETAGAQLCYLPPYSPDLDPIEGMWSKVKNALRNAAARTEDSLYNAIAHTLRTITIDDAQGWFQRCGYGHI